MAENPILDIWRRALETGDTASAEKAVVDQIGAGRITLDHIREVAAWLYGEDVPDSIPQEARVLLGSLLFHAAQRHPSADQNLRFFVSVRLWQAIPSGRRELWRMNAEAARTTLNCAPADMKEKLRASLLGDLGTSLVQLGERREAQQPLEEALVIYRRLAQAEPAAFEQYVAGLLNNLGGVLRDLGGRAQARQAFEEALVVYRRLAQAEPAAFEWYVATTLNNLGAVLNDQGRGALQACEEALAIYRRLAHAQPIAFEQYVATTLNNLGAVLSGLGERPSARQVYEEALAIYRRLAQAKPAAFEPYVATTLNNLGGVLCNLGERVPARQALEEALAIRRRLAQSEPAAFESDVAATLNNLGAVLSGLGERPSARQVYEEALAIYRRLAQAKPIAFEPDMANTLNGLGTALRDLGERGLARQAYEDALTIQRRLAQAEPAAPPDPNVATTLNNLGTVLRDLGERALARQAFEDALRILRRLAQVKPAVFEWRMAVTLTNLGTVMRDLRERQAARRIYEEALAICRRLAQAEPAAFEQYVAGTLHNLGTVLADLEERTQAQQVFEEALAIYRRLAQAEPTAFEQYVADTLSNLGGVLSDLGERAQARQAVEKALVSAQSAEPPVRARVMARLAVMQYEAEEQQSGLELSLEAVEMIEAWLSDPLQVGVRFSFKGEIEHAYRLLLCDPQLESDTGRAHRLIEALREGEFLAEVAPTQPVVITLDRPVVVNDMALLSIQRTHDGSAFLLNSAGDLHFEADDASWAKAADRLLKTVQVSDHTADIAAAGKALWDAAPEWVREVLRSPPSGGVVLSLDPWTGLVPLELMTPTGKPEDFLCLKMEMPRMPGERLFQECLARTVIDVTAEPRALVVGNPWHADATNLPTAERQAWRLARDLDALGFKPALEGKQVWTGADAWARKFVEGLDCNPSVVHFTGHGATASQDECLLFSGNDMLFADGLLLQAKPFPHHPFVFLDSCLTGRTRSYGGAFRGLPIAFLRLGAAAVVASAFVLYEGPAAAFATGFYDKLLARETVGEAMLRTRREMHAAGVNCLHWSRPVLYGNPHAWLKLP